MGISVKASIQIPIESQDFGQQSFPSSEQLALEELRQKSEFSKKFRNTLTDSSISPAQKIDVFLSYVRDKKVESVEKLGGDFLIHGLLECQLIQFADGGYKVNSDNLLVSRKKNNYDSLGYLIQLFSLCLKESYDCIFYNNHHRFTEITLYNSEPNDRPIIKIARFLQVFSILEIREDASSDSLVITTTESGHNFFSEIQNRYPQTIEKIEESEAPWWKKTYQEYFSLCRKSIAVGLFILTALFVLYVSYGFVFNPLKAFIPESWKNFIKTTTNEINDDKGHIIIPPKP